MHPTILVGPVAVPGFALMVVLGIVLGGVLGARQAARAGLDWRITLDIIAWGSVAGVLGAKIYSLISEPRQLTNLTLARFRSVGLVWYGGAIAGIAAGAWRFRRTGFPLVSLFDQGVPALAAGHAVGRIGCLLAGDDYGFSTTLPWGIALPFGAPPSTAGYLRRHGDVIPSAIPNGQIMSVHPAMVYEAIGNAIIAVFLWRRSHLAYRPWSNAALYCVCYGTQRFLLEFIRPKEDMLAIGLTVAQVISLALVTMGLFLLARNRSAERATIQQQLRAA